MFTSDNKKIEGFLRMARLLDYLESNASKEAKVLAIKEERDNGFITQEQAIDLTIEFC